VCARGPGGRAAEPEPDRWSQLRDCGGVDGARSAAWPAAGSPKTRARGSRQNALSQRRVAAGMWVGVPARAHARAPIAGEPCSPVRGSRACDACHAAACASARCSMWQRARSACVGLRSGAPARGAARKGELRVSAARSRCVHWHRADGCAAGFAGYLLAARSGLAWLVGPRVFVRFSVKWQGDMEVTDCCAGQDAETAGLQVGTTARQDHAHPQRSQCRPCQVRHQGTEGRKVQAKKPKP